MSSVTIIDSADVSSGLLYDCPQGALNAGWTQWTDPKLVGGSGMYTRGNGCFVQYTFQGTGVTVYTVPHYDRGAYSCTIDTYPPRWFNGFAGGEMLNATGCSVTGLQDGQHTIRLTNGPMHTWMFAIDWMSIERKAPVQPGTTVTITSELSPYELPSFSQFMPSTLSPTSTGTTQNSSSTPSNPASLPSRTPPGVLIGVAVGLTILALSALILAGFFFHQSRKLRAKLQKQNMDQVSSAIHLVQPFNPNLNAGMGAAPVIAEVNSPVGAPASTSETSDYNPYGVSSSGLSHAPPRYSSPPPAPQRKS